MASRKERHRVVHSSMNLLAPGDKIGPGESQVVDNFRVDRKGVLRTRGAAVLEGAGAFGSGIYHTIRRTSNSRYSGIGTELYFGPEPAGTRLIAGGFDGQPLGMAFYQGFGWVMNRSKQKRIDFDQAHNWGIAAPASKPVATAGAQPLQTLEPYDQTTGQNHVEGTFDGITFSVAMDNDVPASSAVVAASFDSTIANTESASLKMVTNAAASVIASVIPGTPFDTRFNGLAPDEDMFRLFVWASDPKAIKSMTVRLSNMSGANETAWAEANFKDGSAWDPVKVLSQTPRSWTELLIRRILNVDRFQQNIAAAQAAAATGTGSQQVVTDLSASFSQLLRQPTLQIIASSDPQILASNNTPATPVSAFDWTAVARVSVSFVLTSACEIHLNNLRVVSSIGVALTGSLQYFVSFFNNVLEDSNPSPASDEITVNSESVTLSNIPVSTDPDALGRYIYRIGGALNIPERVGVLWDNVATTWDDITSDEDAQNDNNEMPVNRTLPPAARGVIGPYYGKLIAFSTLANPARFFWTPAGQPFCFPGADDPNIGNWEDCGGDDDELLATIDHKQALIFYKQRSIWRLIGDPETADPIRTNANIGIVGPKAVCNAGAVDYLVGPEGVYRFNIDFEEKISQALDPIFKGEWTKLSSSESLPPINRQYIQNTVIEIINNRLRVSYPEIPNEQPTVVAVCDLETGEWCRERFDGLPSLAPTAMCYEGAGRYLMGGFSAGGVGRLYFLENNDFRVDNGTPFHAIWQSRFEDQGLPDNDKSYSDLEIDFETADPTSVLSTLSVYLIFDNLTKVFIGHISSPARRTVILRIPGADENADPAIGYLARNVAVRIEGDINAVAQIYGTYIHWWVRERWALSFDVGHTDLGVPERAKQTDYIEIYMTASGQLLQRTIWSDLPGNLLVIREVATFRAPNGRGTVRFRLPQLIEGRNYRLTIEGVC